MNDDINSYANIAESIGAGPNNILLYNMVDDLTNNMLNDFTTLSIIRKLNIVYSVECTKKSFIKLIALVLESDTNIKSKLIRTSIINSKLPIKNRAGNFKKKVKVLHFNCTERIPQILEYNILLVEPKYIYHGSDSIFISSFMLKSVPVLSKNIAKKDSVITEDFVKSLSYLSDTKFFIDYELLHHNIKMCCSIIELLALEEVKLIDDFNMQAKNEVEATKTIISWYSDDYTKNLKNSYKKKIDNLVELDFPKNIIKSTNKELDYRLDEFIKNIKLDPEFIKKEICKLQSKVVEFNSYEKIEQISLIASQLYYKYSTLTRLFNIDADARVDQIKNHFEVIQSLDYEIFTETFVKNSQ